MSMTADLHHEYSTARLRQLFAKDRAELNKLRADREDCRHAGKYIRREQFWNRSRKYWGKRAMTIKLLINCDPQAIITNK
jgi:hypothetical protein